MITEAAKLFQEFRGWAQKDGLLFKSDQEIFQCVASSESFNGYEKVWPVFKYEKNTKQKKGFNYILKQNFKLVVVPNDKDYNFEILIHKNFTWDGPSIPKRFQDRVSPERLIYASLVHDYLYSSHSRSILKCTYTPQGVKKVANVSFNRHDADIVFLKLCKYFTDELQAGLAFLAVQTFGESHFDKKEKAYMEEVELNAVAT